MVLGAPNELLRLIIIHYMVKYSFGIKTALLYTLWSQRSPLKADLGRSGYKHLVLARNVFLKVVRAPNVPIRLIIINYMFKYTFGMRKMSLKSLWNQKSPAKGRFWQNYL